MTPANDSELEPLPGEPPANTGNSTTPWKLLTHAMGIAGIIFYSSQLLAEVGFYARNYALFKEFVYSPDSRVNLLLFANAVIDLAGVIYSVRCMRLLRDARSGMVGVASGALLLGGMLIVQQIGLTRNSASPVVEFLAVLADVARRAAFPAVIAYLMTRPTIRRLFGESVSADAPLS